MSGLVTLRSRARELGYGLQALLPLPGWIEAPGCTRLWLVCSTGDAVQRRWLAGRTVAACLAEEAATPAETSAGPLDDFCRAELATLLDGLAYRFLFPHPYAELPFPLLKLLGELGWLRPSPLMNTLHAHIGSWWAVRAVVALAGNDEAPVETTTLGADPCLGCAAPCISACPGGAVSRAGWRFEACAAQRLAPASPCAATCPARLACPAGAPLRYGSDVLAYHYGVSLRTLREFASAQAHL